MQQTHVSTFLIFSDEEKISLNYYDKSLINYHITYFLSLLEGGLLPTNILIIKSTSINNNLTF